MSRTDIVITYKVAEGVFGSSLSSVISANAVMDDHANH